MRLYLHLLYFKNSILNRLFSYFKDYFFGTTKPTTRNLFLVILAILTLDTFRSVRFAHRHFISKLSNTSLNAFYYTLQTDTFEHLVWNDVTTKKALSVIPEQLDSQPLFLSIDDTLIEKFGKKFKLSSKLFDHATHNGSNFLNGHCMVSLLLSFPVMTDDKIQYRSIPLGYRLWDKSKSKLALAAEMVTQAMHVIGAKHQVILLCDSWYPKAEIIKLIEQYDNLHLICNIRSDTVLYDLPPAPTGKRGRPKKRGKRLSFEQFALSEPKQGDYKIGTRQVITNLWKDRTVYALVTFPKKGKGSYRLFLSTIDAKEISLNLAWCNKGELCPYAEENIEYLPLDLYAFRWNIEVSYYEGKTFWSMEQYRVRSSCAIERLVNLLSISYSAMTLLPYSDTSFSGYQSASAQETKYAIGQQIQSFVILCSFGEFLETVKNSGKLLKMLETYITSAFHKVQKL